MKIDRRSVFQPGHTTDFKSASKVPFVELHNNRLQGVVSSKSSLVRVYVSFIEAGTTNFYCSTNNNRKCGGLRGYPCKHLKTLLNEALLRYPPERVVSYLGISMDPDEARNADKIMAHFTGSPQKEESGQVFSRFLNYLRFVELEDSNQPVPELAWFLS